MKNQLTKVWRDVEVQCWWVAWDYYRPYNPDEFLSMDERIMNAVNSGLFS